MAPLYQRLYMLLGRQLREGQFPTGRALPGEPQMAARYGVSRVTVRRALDLLEAEGLIERRKGSGTFPLPLTPDGAAGRRTDIAGMLENLISLGQQTEARLLDVRPARVPGWAAHLGHGGEAETVRLTRQRSTPEGVLSLSVLDVPATLAAALDPETLGSEPVIVALERQGVYPATAEQALTVAPADAEVAEAIGVGVGHSVLCMRRVVLDPGGKPILFQESFYPPERFEYRMTLSRIAGGVAPRWMPVR